MEQAHLEWVREVAVVMVLVPVIRCHPMPDTEWGLVADAAVA